MRVPRFSIVIPTRNGARTLPFTLRTCLFQEFEDFEVIVSDNASPPETRAVVKACADKRVRYVRTPAPLPMTASWEFALEQATGEFVTVIGDDDGYLPHSLRELDRILHEVDTRVLRWDAVVYNWPDIVPQHYAQPNALLLPLRILACDYHFIQCHESLLKIKAAAQYRISYAELPMIYCSVIHREVLQQLRRRSGHVFKGRTPDIYSAFAIAFTVDRFHTVNAPFSIAGLSGKSTGIAHLFAKDRNPVDEDFRQLNTQAGYQMHAFVPDLPRLSLLIADAFLRARDALSPNDPSLFIDRKQLIQHCIAESGVETEEQWKHILAACRRSLTDDAALLSWFDSTHGNSPFDSRPQNVRKQAEKRYGGNYLCLDASEFGVQDIVGASELCEKIFGYQRDGMDARPHTPGPEMTTLLDQLQGVLKERERIIFDLEDLCAKRLSHIEELTRRIGALERDLATWPSMRRVVRSALRSILPSSRPRAAA